ncbi:rod-binding protein [Erwinia sorbitola]|uniref:Flagellar rod assembly protein/muramidase FlgJ n=1 Tax=Erwinia sorbitola TaxID=2681984 RepID=A0A6I6EF47_9GAMM|nr:rod-binding protein [Erwinia sorbitola]MTD26951.1 flagellar rod assembly protein/muramidase FlgJ [Erwinia sorbitola]QGU88514.1 flagellar rod assembly protein/muramidase FlgJ [Erwinia sorbitola]
MIKSVSAPLSAGAADFSGRVQPNSLEEAAGQFEAMFLRQMLQEMRKSVDALAGDNGLFSSREARTLRDFYDDALANELASQRTTGIAALLIQQLSDNTMTR